MSIKTQRKIRRVRVTMGVRTMRLDAEDEHRICIETCAKPGATVVPHKKWVRGAWRDEWARFTLWLLQRRLSQLDVSGIVRAHT